MAQAQIMDLIDHARELHGHLSAYYEDLSEQTDLIRVKILLDYLSEAESRHEEALAKYERNFATPDITDTWYQFEPDLLKDEEWAKPNITPGMDADAVLKEVLHIDEHLSELYRDIVKHAHSKRIKDVFTNLLETNEKETKDLARDFAHMHDW
jgi:hypothetical protein